MKQNKDIDKITADIRDIQKTINLNSSTLQRADAVTEELIFAVIILFAWLPFTDKSFLCSMHLSRWNLL